MEEKFSVSLELMIQKFKDNAKKVQTVAQNVAGKIKENMSVDIGGDAFKSMNAESELLLDKINDIKATLNMAKSDNKLFSKIEILEMNTELGKLEKQYEKINQKSNMFSNSFKKIQTNINNSLKSAKRFTLSLFGIQSGLRIVSRAMSAYSTIDEESTKKTQSAWIGLGSMFSWLKDIIANFTIKAVSYINIFVKAMTGVDFLANAMAKSMNKASKSAGKLSKILAGFDEITNLDDDAGGASVDTSWIDAFKNVELDPNVVKWLENIAEKMQPIIKTFEKIKNNIKDIWGKAFAPFFKFVIENWELVGQDFIGGILMIGMLFDVATGNWAGFLLKFVGFVAVYWEDIKNITSLLCEGIKFIIKSALDVIIGLIKIAVENIKIIFSVVQFAITTPIEMAVDIVKGLFGNITSTVKGVIDGIKTILNGLITFITGVFTGNWKKAWEGVRNVFKGIMDTLWGIFKFPLNLIIDGFNVLIKGLNKIKFDVPDWIPFIGGKKWGFNVSTIPKLEVGTPYVERSGYAYIDEGEAVVPKKFNSDEYFSRLGGNNNEQTNKLLEELIDRVERIEINPYITIDDLGHATQKYRSQKSRIMGEELI